MVYEALFERMD